MSDFSKMSLEEQMKLCDQVKEALKTHEIKADVQIYREEVMQLTADAVQARTMLKVEKSLPSSQKAQADRFNAAIEEFKNIAGVQIKVSSVVGPGDDYQTITDVTTLDDTTPVSIEHKEGTVMFIDFWATWCPPCQKPMQHNQDMLTQNAEKWGDKVVIVGLSIDKAADVVKSHIINKGWTKPVHYWRSTSKCSDIYQVQGVPHTMIIDTKGKIVFKGHPANRENLVQDFDDLLAGKEITGKGTAAEAAGSGDAEEKEGDDGAGASTPLETIKAQMAEMDKFNSETAAKLGAECKEIAAGMIRNFCVLTMEASLKPDGNWKSKYTNHRVLVGAKEKVDHCKEKIEEHMAGGTFELNEQIVAQ